MAPDVSKREAARRYGAARRKLFLCSTAIGLIAPYLLWTSGLAPGWWRAAEDLPIGLWPALSLYAPVVLGALALLALPFSYYGGFVLAHQFDLSRQTLGAWLLDWLKATTLGLLIGGAAFVTLYGTLVAAGREWWWMFAILASLALFGLTFVAPYLLVPIFYRMRPLEDDQLREEIRRLSIEARAEVREICTLDFSRKTAEANAAVIGLGRSRRVVLADTLLSEFSLPEIRSVVAHELGHHVHRDVLRLLAVQGALIWTGLGLADLLGNATLAALGAPSGLADPANLALLLLGAELYGLCAMPLANALSRRLESAADRFALQLTADPRAFSSAMRKLADQNLAERDPPRWAVLLLYSHPPIGQRIRLAKSSEHEQAA